MVSRGLERRFQTDEQTSPVVNDGRRLAVHQRRRTYDLGSPDTRDRLVPETYTEQRDAPGGGTYEIHADPRVLGSSGTGRDDDPVEGLVDAPGDVQLVVQLDSWRGAQFGEVLREVPGERVVVVQQQQAQLAT